MTDDDPIAFDPEVQAMIERAKKHIDRKNPTIFAGASTALDCTGSPAISAGASTALDSACQRISAGESPSSDVGTDESPDYRGELDLGTVGPAADILHESWGLTYEDAQLLKGKSAIRLRQTIALECAQSFLAEAQDGGVLKICVLTGTRGVGKTIAAGYAMLTARPSLGGKPWPTERHPIMIAASTIAMWGSYGYAKEREQLARCRVLVIDELGIEDDTRGFRPYLNELMNQRAGAAGYTVITCNLTPHEMTERYGARIMDRLRQRGAWFEINHPSLRVRTP